MINDLPEYGDKNYCGLEEVDGVFRPLALGDVARRVTDLIGTSESPIELYLGSRLRGMLPSRFKLVPQYHFGNYRMDFAVLCDGDACIFIECDGKEFHSTAAQLENDAAKDAAAARAHIPLLRFSGSNIHRNSEACCRQIIALLEGIT